MERKTQENFVPFLAIAILVLFPLMVATVASAANLTFTRDSEGNNNGGKYNLELGSGMKIDFSIFSPQNSSAFGILNFQSLRNLEVGTGNGQLRFNLSNPGRSASVW